LSYHHGVIFALVLFWKEKHIVLVCKFLQFFN
jgi:hypothetical protein